MNRDDLIAPMEFRFTTDGDVEAYGDGWYRYDELAICSQPARALIPLEVEMGSPLAEVMEGFRRDSAFGDMAACWLALRFADRYVPWATFNPRVKLVEWRKAVDEGKEPAEGSPSEGSPQPELLPPPPDTVTLPTLPPGE